MSWVIDCLVFSDVLCSILYRHVLSCSVLSRPVQGLCPSGLLWYLFRESCWSCHTLFSPVSHLFPALWVHHVVWFPWSPLLSVLRAQAHFVGVLARTACHVPHAPSDLILPGMTLTSHSSYFSVLPLIPNLHIDRSQLPLLPVYTCFPVVFPSPFICIIPPIVGTLSCAGFLILPPVTPFCPCFCSICSCLFTSIKSPYCLLSTYLRVAHFCNLTIWISLNLHQKSYLLYTFAI